MIEINLDEARWSSALPAYEAVIHDSIEATLKFENVVDVEVSVLLCDDVRIQQLNAQYRGKDKPTNVLSFPQDAPPLLGDIALALETIEREAIEQDKSFEHHLRHLVVHGTLHLLGYDHIEEAEAEDMEAREVKILEGLNVKNPYEDGFSMA